MCDGAWFSIVNIPRQICRGLIEASWPYESVAPPSNTFPGKFAGASLKPVAPERKLIGATRIPRQICRGLIEARKRAGGRNRRGAIPRQICRGLIEAHACGRRARRVLRAFPGKFAGASLKHDGAVSARWHLAVIPRQICRGLIEAGPRGARETPYRSPIPRQICRGLIEAKISRGMMYSSSITFPGKFAGASLKPGGGEIRFEGGESIPRQICRGLIEAGGST